MYRDVVIVANPTQAAKASLNMKVYASLTEI